METQTSTYTIETGMPNLHGSHSDMETTKRMFDFLGRQKKPKGNVKIKIMKRTIKKKAKR